MKTTIDIPAPLLERTKEYAREQDRTVKSLVEEALQAMLDRYAAARPRAVIDAAVGGQGLTLEYQHKGQAAVVGEMYEERMGRSVHAADWTLVAHDRG